MRLKFNDFEEGNCLLESLDKSFSIVITKENEVNIKCRQHIITINLQKTIPKKRWTHLALIWHCDADKPIQVLINGILSGSSDEKIEGKNWVEEDIDLCKFKGMVTEIRIWSTNLNEKIINDNKKMPLPILANRETHIQLSSNKETKEPTKEKQKNMGQQKKAA